MVWDAHTHLGPTVSWMPNYDFDVSVKAYLGFLKKNRVKRAIALPNPQSGDYSKANDFVAKATKEHSQIIGFGRVDPRAGKNAVLEVERCFSLGLQGIKLHPHLEFFYPSHPAFFSLYEKCLDLKMPIEFHSDKAVLAMGSPDSFSGLLKKFPKLTVLFGHLLDLKYAQYAKLYRNVFVVTSLAPTPQVIESAVKIAGENKVLFGSDWPYLGFGFEKAKVGLASLSKNAKKKIFEKNLQRLF